MRKIDLKGKQGEEIELTNGANTSLVIKIDGDKIIPDFVDALTYAVVTHPRDIATAARSFMFGAGGDVQRARTIFAKIRDDAFTSVVVPDVETEPAVTITSKDSKEGKK